MLAIGKNIWGRTWGFPRSSVEKFTNQNIFVCRVKAIIHKGKTLLRLLGFLGEQMSGSCLNPSISVFQQRSVYFSRTVTFERIISEMSCAPPTFLSVLLSVLTNSSTLSGSVWRALHLSFTAAPVDAFWEFPCKRKFRKVLFELKSSKRLLSSALSLLVIYLECCYSFKQHAETVWYEISDLKKDLIKSFGKSFTFNVNGFGMMFRTCNHFPVETKEWKKYP